MTKKNNTNINFFGNVLTGWNSHWSDIDCLFIFFASLTLFLKLKDKDDAFCLLPNNQINNVTNKERQNSRTKYTKFYTNEIRESTIEEFHTDTPCSFTLSFENVRVVPKQEDMFMTQQTVVVALTTNHTHTYTYYYYRIPQLKITMTSGRVQNN